MIKKGEQNLESRGEEDERRSRERRKEKAASHLEGRNKKGGERSSL